MQDPINGNSRVYHNKVSSNMIFATQECKAVFSHMQKSAVLE